MKVSVKVGSRKVYVEIYKTTTCKHLIKQCLNECKIGIKAELKTHLQNTDISKHYSLFERALGIEREIQPHENIFEIWLKWSLQSTQRIEFLVRMCQPISMQKQSNRRLSLDNHNPEKIFKIYKSKYPVQTSDMPKEYHSYENFKVITSVEPLPVKSQLGQAPIRKANKQPKYLKTNNPLLSCIRTYKVQNTSMERLISLEV